MSQIQSDRATDLDAHTQMHDDFFGTLFDRDDLVLVVAGLGDEKHEALCECLGDWPEEVGGRKTTYFDKDLGRNQPFHFLKPFIVSQASIATRDLAALHEINRQGYDIYFAINPVSCGRRCQKTVTLARHILIESDKNDIDAQLRFLKEHEDNIVSAVHSGGKSVHCLVRVVPPRPNPGVVGAGTAFRLRKGATRATWAEYRQMAAYWREEALKWGVVTDPLCVSDYARVSRVPGVAHAGTGRRAEIIRLNPSASWDWRSCTSAPRAIPVASVSPGSVRTDPPNRDDSFSFSPPNPENPTAVEPSGGTAEDTTATKCVVRAPSKGAASSTPQRSFLDHIADFERLRRDGLPGRHVRREMHRALFEATRVFKWDETRMAKEWAAVIRRNPSSTPEPPESAVEDMLRAFHATARIGIYLPDISRLPDLDDRHVAEMLNRLDRLGCAETAKAARIISRVLVPLVRTRPGRCVIGTVRIPSEALRKAANCRGPYRGHAEVWRWMQEIKLIKCVKRGYRRGFASRLYRINIPMLVWLCGFKTNDLIWDMAR